MSRHCSSRLPSRALPKPPSSKRNGTGHCLTLFDWPCKSCWNMLLGIGLTLCRSFSKWHQSHSERLDGNSIWYSSLLPLWHLYGHTLRYQRQRACLSKKLQRYLEKRMKSQCLRPTSTSITLITNWLWKRLENLNTMTNGIASSTLLNPRFRQFNRSNNCKSGTIIGIQRYSQVNSLNSICYLIVANSNK